ncbi:MAG: hypothetical protein HKN29_14435, partial [Rhodothermales bacterium]|nr:hypothetical protein [Rhodothermales bacterium]
MSFRILAVLLFLVSPSSARQSDSAVGLLSAAQMEEDTAILVAAMTQLHPGL